MTCGFVLVSHSAPLAEAVRALACQMTPDRDVVIACAAGTDDDGVGTDAMRVLDAIERVGAQCDEVLVFTDLGSAIMSAQSALDFADPELAARTRLSQAPFVEGVVGATARASLGHDLATIEREARRGLAPKAALIGDEPPTHAPGALPAQLPSAAESSTEGDPFDPALPRLEYDLVINPEDYQRAPSVVEEIERFTIARARAAAAVTRLSEASTDPRVRETLATVLALVNDRRLSPIAAADIEAGASAFEAVEGHLTDLAARVASAPTDELREQAVDLHLVARLILGSLIGTPFAGVVDARDIHTACVLVVPELDAVTAALARPSAVRGIEVKAWTPTGHGVTIAEALGVPVRPAP